LTFSIIIYSRSRVIAHVQTRCLGDRPLLRRSLISISPRSSSDPSYSPQFRQRQAKILSRNLVQMSAAADFSYNNCQIDSVENSSCKEDKLNTGVFRGFTGLKPRSKCITLIVPLIFRKIQASSMEISPKTTVPKWFPAYPG